MKIGIELIATKENFFYNDKFYSDLTECCDYNDWDEEYIASLPDDYKLEVTCADLQPIVNLDANWISERIDDERFSEDNCDKETEKIMKVLNENIDFEKINSLMPKLYYSTRTKVYFTKQDLLKANS